MGTQQDFEKKKLIMSLLFGGKVGMFFVSDFMQGAIRLRQLSMLGGGYLE